jgi:hypothetical protein
MSSNSATSVNEHEVEPRSLNDIITWLIPLLREYATKLDRLASNIHSVAVGWTQLKPGQVYHYHLPEIARLICLNETYQRTVPHFTRQASGITEHAPIDDEARNELIARREEVEDGLRFCQLASHELFERLSKSGCDKDLRSLIERSGRYKSPV